MIFDSALEKYDFNRNEKKLEKWDYEKYNSYNLLTRYWKSTVRHWNLEMLKDYQNSETHNHSISHRMVFLNQLIYRLSTLTDEKSKRTLVNNFFKIKHFQEIDFSNYVINNYDYHQLCFLLNLSPEVLLYTSHIFSTLSVFNKSAILPFLEARYTESLRNPLNDEQLFYYYALKCYSFEAVLHSTSDLVLSTQNQILISYYLKDNIFTQDQKDSLKLLTYEIYWFQNYHLILFSPELMSNLLVLLKNILYLKMLFQSQIKNLDFQNFIKVIYPLELN